MRILSLFVLMNLCASVWADGTGLLALWPQKMSISASGGYGLYPVGGEWVYDANTLDDVRQLDAQHWSRGLGWTQRVAAEMVLNDWIQWRLGYMHVANQLHTRYSNSISTGGEVEALWTASGTQRSELHAFEIGAKIRKELDYWTILFGMDVVLPIGVSVTQTDHTQLAASTLVDEWDYRGGRLFGMNQSLTVKRPITERFAVYGQMNVNWTTYAPERMIRTRAELNGVNILPELSTAEKEYYFSSSYSTNTAKPDPTAESHLLQEEMSFGSLGFSLGVELVIMD